LNEIGTSNWFPSKARYSRDVRLARLEPILPVKLLLERSNFLRDEKLAKYG